MTNMEKNENGLSRVFPNSAVEHKKHQLAMVYSPLQCWRMLYSPEEALMKGTLFEELYKPLEEEL